jgi:benzylsuccinate CoA-transferase BbsE subunit
MRGWEPFLDDQPGPERSLYWWHYNTSKRGVTLDLEAPRGRELFRRLAQASDLLLEGEDPGRLTALRLDWADLQPLAPRLVMVSVTPFGRAGPRSGEQATDLTLLASGGPAWSCGYDDHGLPPVRGGGNQAWHTGAHFAVMSALIALLARDEIGRGQHVDVNVNAACNVTTEAGSYHYLVDGSVVQRQTGRHAMATLSPPSQVRCADGRWINTGVGLRQPRDFAALCGWLESAGLDRAFPKFELLQRAAGRPDLDAIRARTDPEVRELAEAGREAVCFLAERLPAYQMFVESQRRGLPMGIVYSPEEALEDPHHRARGLGVEVEHEELGRRITYPGAPYLFHGTPWRIRRRAPHVGEHNTEVWRELGIGVDEQAPSGARSEPKASEGLGRPSGARSEPRASEE